MDFVFLTRSFYTNHASLIEAEQKVERPYTVTIVKVRGCDFAIPLRSHIKHPHALFTDRQKTKGLDLSKAVIIDGLVDIDRSTTPHIDPSEFSFLKGKEFILTQRMNSYISEYETALLNLVVPRNHYLCTFSTLQNYHSILGIGDGL